MPGYIQISYHRDIGALCKKHQTNQTNSIQITHLAIPGPRRHGPSSLDHPHHLTIRLDWLLRKSWRCRVWRGKRWGGRTCSQSEPCRESPTPWPPPCSAAIAPSRHFHETDAGYQSPSGSEPHHNRPPQFLRCWPQPRWSPSEPGSALGPASAWKRWASR